MPTKPDEKDENKILVKLYSQDWEEGELMVRFFEGYWVVNNMKLSESNIKEIEEPGWIWWHGFE